VPDRIAPLVDAVRRIQTLARRLAQVDRADRIDTLNGWLASAEAQPDDLELLVDDFGLYERVIRQGARPDKPHSPPWRLPRPR
jgi:hypothetical protein